MKRKSSLSTLVSWIMGIRTGIGLPVLLRMALVALTMAVVTPTAWAKDTDSDLEPEEDIVALKDARLKIELNATDGDAGIQVFIDADPWSSMEIYDPNDKLVFRSITRGRFGKQGGTELFLESAEPNFSELSLAEFLKRFPEGEYQFRGSDLEGETLVGTAILTHNLADGMMPATATSLAVPPGFLLPDTEYEWEVLAIEEGGNQTLSTAFFQTAP